MDLDCNLCTNNECLICNGYDKHDFYQSKNEFDNVTEIIKENSIKLDRIEKKIDKILEIMNLRKH